MIKQQEIIKIYYNWYATNEQAYYDVAEVGLNGVAKIIRHPPQGLGDKLYYIISYDDGTLIEVFNPNRVVYGL